MNRGFWDKLPHPFWVLAPMYDVTDLAFRQIVINCGKPHVFFTEFTSSDGLASAGRDRLMHQLAFKKNEHPIVAQIFGNKPEKFLETAKLVQELGFDGIDLNTGCPDKAVMRQGSCAALFKTPELTKEILLAMKEGARNIPVSVKIRIGDTKIDWESWISKLLEASPSAISIHLRTRKEASKVPAHWEIMPNIVKFIHSRTTESTRPLVIGNGDIESLEQAKQKVKETNCDGIMIGRGIFHNPWIFNEKVNPATVSPAKRAQLLMEHAKKFEELFAEKKPFDVIKRFFKIYITSFPNATEVREELYNTKSVTEAEEILKKHRLI